MSKLNELLRGNTQLSSLFGLGPDRIREKWRLDMFRDPNWAPLTERPTADILRSIQSDVDAKGLGACYVGLELGELDRRGVVLPEEDLGFLAITAITTTRDKQRQVARQLAGWGEGFESYEQEAQRLDGLLAEVQEALGIAAQE